MYTGEFVVAVDALPTEGAEQIQARLDEAVAAVNASLGQFGTTLIQIQGDASTEADMHLRFDTTSVLGGVADGVLAVTESNGTITIISGWEWYLGSDSQAVSSTQYDFLTIVSHELYHGVGLGHSTTDSSVMYPYLGSGDAHRSLTDGDLWMIHESEQVVEAEALMALPSKPVLSWQNAKDRFDVNGDGVMAPIDVILLINQLNHRGSSVLPQSRTASDMFLDVNGDGSLTPSDVILVINNLNAKLHPVVVTPTLPQSTAPLMNVAPSTTSGNANGASSNLGTVLESVVGATQNTAANTLARLMVRSGTSTSATDELFSDGLDWLE
jgi:hypothetical protein